MKKQMLLLLASAVGTVLIFSALPAWALNGILVAKVPFKFIVQDTTLPAGTYEISTDSPSDPELLLIQSEGGGASVLVLAQLADQPAGQQPKAELVFSRIGDTEFLTRVRSDEGGLEYQIPEPKLHMQLTHKTTDIKNLHSISAHHRNTKKQGTR
jgi:hypothetical protein